MSAFALPALALANRAVSALPALFSDLAMRAPPGEITRLDSTGYFAEGQGAGQYITDALADDALLAAHPRFAFATANGRIFRLLPADGAIAAEQGGAAGDGSTNDQPAVQAAIDYAEAIGAREVRFENAHYRIDCPVRNSPLADTRAEDGHPIVVRRSLTLRGVAPTRTVFDFRGLDGADPEAGFQLVDTSSSDPTPAVWRGGGLFAQGDAIDPSPSPRRIARLELARLVFQGNRLHTGNYVWPADPATGDGWDITDKAFWLQDCYAGDILLSEVDMIGWKGEIFYSGGALDAVRSIHLEKCRFLTSNGSAFNPGTDARLVARDCEFGDAGQAQEDAGKTHAVYRNCLWRDAGQVALGSGPTAGILYHVTYPTRDESTQPPRTVLDGCEFRNIATFALASWLTGSIRLFDTVLVVDTQQSQAPRDVDLQVEAWLDQIDEVPVLSLYGPPTLTEPVTGAPAGVYRQPPTNMRFRIRHYRTALAQREGRTWRAPIWTGYIDKSCRIESEGDFAHSQTPNGGAAPTSFPFVAFERGEASYAYVPHGWFVPPLYSASGEIAPAGPVMAVGTQGDVHLTMTLARYPAGGTQFGHAEGQRLRLVKLDSTGSLTFLRGAAPGNYEVNADRTLAKVNDRIEFTYNGLYGRWEESAFFSSS